MHVRVVDAFVIVYIVSVCLCLCLCVVFVCVSWCVCKCLHLFVHFNTYMCVFGESVSVSDVCLRLSANFCVR